jgi:hypothetical protein
MIPALVDTVMRELVEHDIQVETALLISETAVSGSALDKYMRQAVFYMYTRRHWMGGWEQSYKKKEKKALSQIPNLVAEMMHAEWHLVEEDEGRPTHLASLLSDFLVEAETQGMDRSASSTPSETESQGLSNHEFEYRDWGNQWSGANNDGW